MQYFIDSYESFYKTVEIGEQLENRKDFCTSKDVRYPPAYNIKKDIVFFYYTFICEYIVGKNHFLNNPTTHISELDIDFLNNMLGDFLDESYFNAEFISKLITDKNKEYSRVLIPVAPYFFFLSHCYDHNRKGNLFSEIYKLSNKISVAYETGYTIDIAFDGPHYTKFKTIFSYIKQIDCKTEEADEVFKTTNSEMTEFFKQNTIVIGTDHIQTRNDPEIGTYVNPILRGASGYFCSHDYNNKLEIIVDQVICGDDAYILARKNENCNIIDQPEAGQEYLFIKIRLKLLDAQIDSEVIDPNEFHLISENRKDYGRPIFELSNDTATRLLYTGTEREDLLAFIVNKNDKPFIRFRNLWFATI